VLSYTSIIATIGAINAAIAPSSDFIQQLLYDTYIAKWLSNIKLHTNDQFHSVGELFQLKLQLLEWLGLYRLL